MQNFRLIYLGACAVTKCGQVSQGVRGPVSVSMSPRMQRVSSKKQLRHQRGRIRDCGYANAFNSTPQTRQFYVLAYCKVAQKENLVKRHSSRPYTCKRPESLSLLKRASASSAPVST